ncbi:MAG: bifunctional hydroxymethylpyrimidine kinase/phosphomethylpyrimidine kinase, partial [Thermoproteota archaeon]|nr:bifunctional hydroxymethylpyrimidine kinase/phosphomethylpyrimidine kinase [Thermoproteota archaeon]
MKVALSIAGSDSGAGAGIQADLKMFSALGVYGCTAITTITAQNTKHVDEIFEMPASMVEQQIRAVMDDIPPNAIKIGMVYSSSIIEAVCRSVKKMPDIPVVLDPILAAGTGSKLLRNDAYESFRSKLLPSSSLVTPNKMEAENLSHLVIKTEKDAIQAAKKIRKLGVENVIIKGGHFVSEYVTDLLIDAKGNINKFKNPRLETKEIHGSGCNFSAAITAYLAKGMAVVDACKLANEYVHTAIRSSIKVGKGLPVANTLSTTYRDANCYRTLVELQHAADQVSMLDGLYRLIPETQTNFAYAIPDASNISDVAAVRGRIVKIENTAVSASYVKFGASSHVASAVIAYMSVKPEFRAAINLKFDNRIVNVCNSLFRVTNYDRTE